MVLLAGWGCPIGELFDLEKLAAHCKKEKRYSFFITSEPTNVPGGVARSDPPSSVRLAPKLTGWQPAEHPCHILRTSNVYHLRIFENFMCSEVSTAPF